MNRFEFVSKYEDCGLALPEYKTGNSAGCDFMVAEDMVIPAWHDLNFSLESTAHNNCPMYYIWWEEAMEFCRILSNKTGKTYTLPTEAQWEYAARGGKKTKGTKYAGSNAIDSVAWYKNNSSDKVHPCGSKCANELGLYDMSGNVCEWCLDWYTSAYLSYDTSNPSGPNESTRYGHVYRGGCFDDFTRACRVSCRKLPAGTLIGHGFRVVCLP